MLPRYAGGADRGTRRPDTGLRNSMVWEYDDGAMVEMISDNTWQTRRAPIGDWTDVTYDSGNWPNAVMLAPGVTP